MVLSIEPGYYEAERFGIRIENLYEIIEESDGFLSFRSITLAPIQTDMLIVNELSGAERDWLNRYHSEVRKRLSPHLSDSAKTWLAAATADI